MYLMHSATARLSLFQSGKRCDSCCETVRVWSLSSLVADSLSLFHKNVGPRIHRDCCNSWALIPCDANGLFCTILHHMRDHRSYFIRDRCITGQAKRFYKVTMNQQGRILKLLLILHKSTLTFLSPLPRPVLLQKVMQRMQKGGQIGEEFGIITEKPKPP